LPIQTCLRDEPVNPSSSGSSMDPSVAAVWDGCRNADSTVPVLRFRPHVFA
jgi:hypothetical protein